VSNKWNRGSEAKGGKEERGEREERIWRISDDIKLGLYSVCFARTFPSTTAGLPLYADLEQQAPNAQPLNTHGNMPLCEECQRETHKRRWAVTPILVSSKLIWFPLRRSLNYMALLDATTAEGLISWCTWVLLLVCGTACVYCIMAVSGSARSVVWNNR